MSNPFKKQNNQKPQEMLLDRIIKQNAQNPGLQLNSILPTTSNNGNNGQRVITNQSSIITQQNRILAPSPPETSLLIKILGKDGVALGSFRLDRSEVL